MMNKWSGKHILIIGAARQGLALARYLVDQGAIVTVNDQQTTEKFDPVLKEYADLNIQWILGSHPIDALNGKDLVCVSGGVPLDLPILIEAQNRDLQISNDSQIFMEENPATTIGITGSAGKTTTTTLVGEIAKSGLFPPRTAWVGGNIGLPLINFLPQINKNDLVILELSSFQLEQMTISPQIAAILNITPNHLDRHGTLEAYTQVKARILKFQKETDSAILNREDPGSWNLTPLVKGKLISFGLSRPAKNQIGTFCEREKLMLQTENREIDIMPVEAIQLRGEHNLINVLAACAIGYAAGLSVDGMQSAISKVKGISHRVELVREINHVRWYNDSIATAPERTIAAIHAFNEPIVLLLGGKDKNLPWDRLARLIHERVDHVVLFGDAAEKIEKAIGNVQPGQRPLTMTRCEKMADAIFAAHEVSEPGDVVLLSPGGTSFDEFNDFEERGERFREWVSQLQ